MHFKTTKSLKYALIAFVFISGLSGGLFAQKLTLSLDDAISLALKNNRDLKIATLDIQKAEAAVDEAFGYALPSVDVNANFAHFLEKPKMPFPDFEAMLNNSTYGVLFQEGLVPEDNNKLLPMGNVLQSFAQTNNFESSVQVSQILFNSAVFTGIGASEIYLDLAKENEKSVSSKTVSDVKTAFYGSLLTKELSIIMNESLENAQKNLANVKALYDEGLASEYDYLQVKVQVENLKPRVKELKNVFQNAKNMLKLLLGIEQSQVIQLKGSLDYKKFKSPQKDELVARCLKSNLNLNTLKIKRRVDEEMITIDKSEYWPTIAAFGEYAYNGSSDEFDFDTYSSSTIGLNFSLNLFKGGRVSSSVQQAKITLKQTDEQISTLEDFLQTQMTNKLNELLRIESEITALEGNVKLAEKAYKIADTRYKEGTGTQLEIKNADLELRMAKTNLMQSAHDYLVTLAEIDNLLGRNDYK